MFYPVYNTIVVGTIAILFATMGWFTITLEPFDGDLTRIGNYVESEFGYNEPQEAFVSNLSTFANNPDQYVSYHDMVVIGDSFSHQEARFFGWQNYLVKATGLSIITFWAHTQTNTLKLLQQNETFRSHPPRILILQSVERGLFSRVQRWPQPGPCIPSPDLVLSPLTIVPQTITTLTHSRKTKNTVLAFQGTIEGERFFDHALHYMNLGLLKVFRPGSGTPVEELTLIRGHLFSNKRPSRLLVLKDDFKKAKLTKDDLSEIRCWIWDRKMLIEQQYPTHLIVLLGPDKTSAYSEFIKDSLPEYHGIIEKIPDVDKMPVPRIDIAIQRSIKNGKKDVYLPNDSHWGAKGNEIAATALLEYLLKKKIVDFSISP